MKDIEWQFSKLNLASSPKESKTAFKWGYEHGQWRALEFIKTHSIDGFVSVGVIEDMLEQLKEAK